jgi:hypothetical protein
MLKKYLLSKKFFIRFVFFLIIFLHIIFAFQNYGFFAESLRLGFGFASAYGELFDVRSTFDMFTLIVALLTIVLSAYNFALLMEFVDQQKAVQKNSLNKTNGFFGISFILAIIGTHCVSCSAALFGGLISLTTISFLPFGGKEIGVAGVVLLILSARGISNKVNYPYVC